MKFCGKCGTALDNTKKFCNNCGAANPFFETNTRIAPLVESNVAPNNELEKLLIEKERIARERIERERLEKELLERMKLEQERREREKIEQQKQEEERLKREKEDKAKREILAAQQRELELRRQEQDAMNEKEKLIIEQSEILQKVKLEREILERELEQISKLRLQREKISAEIPVVEAVPKPKKGKATWKRVFMFLLGLIIFSGIGVEGYFFGIQLLPVNNYKLAKEALAEGNWPMALNYFEKVENEPGDKTKLTESEKENLQVCLAACKGLSEIAPLGNNAQTVKYYWGIIGKAGKVQFDKLKDAETAMKIPADAINRTEITLDSVKLYLLNLILDNPDKISMIGNSIVYQDDNTIINYDSIESAIVDMNAPEIQPWFKKTIDRKNDVVSNLPSAKSVKGKNDIPVAKTHAQNVISGNVNLNSGSAVSDIQIKHDLVGKNLAACSFAINNVGEITLFRKSQAEKTNGNIKYGLNMTILHEGVNYVAETDVYYDVSGNTPRFSNLVSVNCDSK